MKCWGPSAYQLMTKPAINTADFAPANNSDFVDDRALLDAFVGAGADDLSVGAGGVGAATHTTARKLDFDHVPRSTCAGAVQLRQPNVH